jgi:hypothetical protein
MRRKRSGCCAHTPLGHAATPPTRVMNSRRLMPAPSSGDGILAAQNGTLVGLKPASRQQHEMQPNVVVGSKADNLRSNRHVRFPL